jgi:signal transduction histidine kinase
VRRRILLAILLAVAVTAAVLGIPLGIVASWQIESSYRETLAENARAAAAILDTEIANGQEIDLDQVRAAVPANGLLTVRASGQEEKRYGSNPGPDTVTETADLARDGKVEIAVPAGPMHERQTTVTLVVVLLVLLSIGTGAVVAIATARRLAKPLRHVAERAARLGGGDFRPDPSRYGVGELDMVAEALDASGTALAQLVQRERQLVGDVSHQLRSRLTALHLRLEALAAVDDADVSEEAGAALEQAERLSAVLDDLLAAATAARARDAEPLDVTSLLNQVADEWREPLRNQGRTLRLKIGDELLARATPARLREAIGVLLDNALRHGEGPVTLTARHGGGTVLIEVSDAGSGVPDELVPHVFERGFSGHGSTGVGLALARALVEADGGRLELSQARPAMFEVFLRVARADDVLGLLWKPEPTPR